MDGLNLSQSKLGSKGYWDDFYKVEVANFETNPEDTGENWFDESNAEDKVVEFLVDNFEQLSTIDTNSTILDVGTGNGHLLFEIRTNEEGLFGANRLVGIDYSENSIKFAKLVAKNKQLEKNMEFYQVDFLKNYQEFIDNSKFQDIDIILDKGTLDAIALNDQQYEYLGQEDLGYNLYGRILERIIKPDGLLIITSCNFSETELENVITSNTSLKVWKRVKYPSFQFGGVKGSTVCTIAFIKQRSTS